LDFGNLSFLRDCKFDGFLRQAAAFAEHVASGALTLEFAAERQQLEGRIERLQAQHTEAVQDKSAAENNSRKLKEKLTAMDAEKEDLGR
jgi:phage shock protein A